MIATYVKEPCINCDEFPRTDGAVNTTAGIICKKCLLLGLKALEPPKKKSKRRKKKLGVPVAMREKLKPIQGRLAKQGKKVSIIYLYKKFLQRADRRTSAMG